MSEVMNRQKTRNLATRDKKRYFWWLPLFIAISPIVGIEFYKTTGNAIYAWFTPILWYLFVPLGDFLFGRDDKNYSAQRADELENDNYYKWLVFLSVPLFFVTWMYGAWWVSTQAVSVSDYLGMTIGVALTNGLALVVGHELGHKNNRLEKNLAKWVLAVPAYGHFSAEHNRGHHKDVATPDDPASARMGESLYRFVLREIPGAFVRAFHDEKVRLERKGKSVISAENQILQSFAITFVLYGAALTLWGTVVIPFMVISTLWGWQFLSTSNYIEHYGLLRQKQEDGRFERTRPEHSWNADFRVSNLVTYHLQRHSDHHSRPTRRYQVLRSDDAPELPTGYAGCFTMAYFTPIWRKVMDPKVLEVYGGDILKANLDPKHRDALIAKYGRAS
ncbi:MULTISPECIES: alkane 1-monooxygenase [Spongiibacter]|uniref:Alkane 1-monooxygenase n=1 Tax=Spongiibacter thalassae TaxID=2721624 RepID=A0ABX1GKA7_9GAMM|nr:MULTISPECIES: alkane 1-monooxygenase [Spongiibacter]MAY37924.1 alkane 1-monooxygenase [Spongiibacter sp.]MBI57709.1 alkane 1-monooxygenase [Spongiibacter sp.]NKI18594.1 alkane 1-monooxygenase [Spongiibacter thalassae]|tara:strand:- start:22723 stop:23892 length:1170 start_codon:yes stop_codon:yes gene_type:complete